jgi:hypothetical protein
MIISVIETSNSVVTPKLALLIIFNTANNPINPNSKSIYGLFDNPIGSIVSKGKIKQ